MSGPDDPVRMAMEAMVDALEEIEARLGPIKERLGRALALRAEGRSYSEIGSQLEGSPVIAMLSSATESLAEAVGRLRRTAAVELHHEGMTMEQIARLFGVSRQRVSALLRQERSR